MRTILILVFIFPYILTAKEKKEQYNPYYEDSYNILVNMLENESQYNFKKAVFSVEYAYFQGNLDTLELNNQIQILKSLAQSLIQNRILVYKEKDIKKVNVYAAVYSLICQEIPIQVGDKVQNYKPFAYDFEDVFGNKKWSNLFLSKLLQTKKGNCNSLPYLYKILVEELGGTAYLALAPNHIYIKHKIKSAGWYNTELTSGIFPEDSWLMASGYIHLDAITNGVFMKALNDKESIALCLIDLAEAYQQAFPENDGKFILKCTQKAIELYPYFANALILKAETHKSQLEKLMKESNFTNLEMVNPPPEIKELLEQIELQYTHIHEIGYRNMPQQMYLEWLVSLKTERDKYENKKLSNFIN